MEPSNAHNNNKHTNLPDKNQSHETKSKPNKKNLVSEISKLPSDIFTVITSYLDVESTYNLYLASATSDKKRFKHLGKAELKNLKNLMESTNTLLQFCEQVVEQTNSTELKHRLNAIKKSESFPLQHAIIPGSQAVTVTAKANRLIEEILHHPLVKGLSTIKIDKINTAQIEEYIPELLDKIISQNNSIKLSVSTTKDEFVKNLVLIENSPFNFEIELKNGIFIPLNSLKKSHQKLEALLNLINHKLDKKEQEEWTKLELDNLEKALNKIVFKYREEIKGHFILSKLFLKITGEIDSIKYYERINLNKINDLRNNLVSKNDNYIDFMLQDLSGSKGMEALKKLEQKYKGWSKKFGIKLFLKACEKQGDQAIKLLLSSKIFNADNQIIEYLNKDRFSPDENGTVVLCKLMQQHKIGAVHSLLKAGVKINYSQYGNSKAPRNWEETLNQILYSLSRLSNSTDKQSLLLSVIKNSGSDLELHEIKTPSDIDSNKPPLLLHIYEKGNFKLCKAILEASEGEDINRSIKAIFNAALAKRDFETMKELFSMYGNVLSKYKKNHPMTTVYNKKDLEMMSFFVKHKQTLNHLPTMTQIILNWNDSIDLKTLEIIKESSDSLLEGLKHLIDTREDRELYDLFNNLIDKKIISDPNLSKKLLEDLILNCDSPIKLSLIKLLFNKKAALNLVIDDKWANKMFYKLVEHTDNRSQVIEWFLSQKSFSINFNKKHKTLAGSLNYLEYKLFKELEKDSVTPSAFLLRWLKHDLNVDFDKKLSKTEYKEELKYESDSDFDSDDDNHYDITKVVNKITRKVTFTELLRENRSFAQSLINALEKERTLYLERQLKQKQDLEFVESLIIDKQKILDPYNASLAVIADSKQVIPYHEYLERYNKLAEKYPKNISICQQMINRVQEEIKDKEQLIQIYRRDLPNISDKIRRLNLERATDIEQEIPDLTEKLTELKNTFKKLQQGQESAQKSLEANIAPIIQQKDELKSELETANNRIEKLTHYLSKLEA
ncbi:MAG: hypothetical protein K0S74_376 [Chlamydiales bacterium]|jgi:hypothetical protein|nr:hypothetical protein [Chlamydiales bacterium]